MKQPYELDAKYENDMNMVTLFQAFEQSPETIQEAFLDMILSQRDATNLKPTLLDQIKFLDPVGRKELLHELIDFL